MKPESVADLIAALRKYRLLSDEQLRQVSEQFAAAFPKPIQLAWHLLQLGWLTAYQVDQLMRHARPELICGPYLLLARLGQGGVCRVFKAKDTRTEAIVALKVLHESFHEKPEILRRFQREIETIVRLDHPNIVKAYDVYLSASTGYLAMEYLAGSDLGRILEKRGALPIAEACYYIQQAALGLQYAHEEGLVHRDIKPQNIFVTEPDCRVRILDLGLVRNRFAPHGMALSATFEGNILGTPDYIAPEQARNPKTVDIRADIYSLGCTFFQLLTNRPPFLGNNVMEKLMRHQMEPPPVLTTLRNDVPAPLANLIGQMLRKKPDERPATPGEVAEALTPWVER